LSIYGGGFESLTPPIITMSTTMRLTIHIKKKIIAKLLDYKVMGGPLEVEKLGLVGI